MMGRTLRKQIVVYAMPPFHDDMKNVAEVARARGQRATLSSLGDEAMQAGWPMVRPRYMPTQETPGKPKGKPKR